MHVNVRGHVYARMGVPVCVHVCMRVLWARVCVCACVRVRVCVHVWAVCFRVRARVCARTCFCLVRAYCLRRN